jgi:orotate phosphoribosyltransferase
MVWPEEWRRAPRSFGKKIPDTVDNNNPITYIEYILLPLIMSTSIPQYKRDFLNACTQADCLKFGSFTLKSGRQSPYFFNAGMFHRGALLRALSSAFAQTIAAQSDLDFDILFGPAYKGIPLAVAGLDKLSELDEKRYGHVSYSFNRKEAKDHGDGGTIVGAPLKGKKVLIVDDVMTAGTAVKEAVGIIESQGGVLAGIVVALDRMEKAPAKEGEDEDAPRKSTLGEVRDRYGVPVVAVLTLDDIVEGFKKIGTKEQIQELEEYRAKYQASG